MIGQLAQIWRHPIKGIGAERLEHVGLHPDRPLPMDRAWAVLDEVWGHSDFGIPAMVRRAGRVATGDKVSCI